MKTDFRNQSTAQLEKRLRDLVDNDDCDWSAGEEIRRLLEVQAIKAALAARQRRPA
jgi:hypothetical protein